MRKSRWISLLSAVALVAFTACGDEGGEKDGFLDGYHMGIFVGDHITQPVSGTAHDIIQILCPDLYFVIKKISTSVGIIIGIPNNKMDFS